MAINVFVILRVFIGLLLVVSGFGKLAGPYQNFLYVIQTYEFLPSAIEEVAARIVPWVEFFTGLFLVLGLWLKISLRAAACLFLSFIGILLQALIRKLPIDECGCFGEGLSLPPQVMLGLDVCLLAVTVFLIFRIDKSLALSLDRFYNEK